MRMLTSIPYKSDNVNHWKEKALKLRSSLSTSIKINITIDTTHGANMNFSLKFNGSLFLLKERVYENTMLQKNL